MIIDESELTAIKILLRVVDIYLTALKDDLLSATELMSVNEVENAAYVLEQLIK